MNRERQKAARYARGVQQPLTENMRAVASQSALGLGRDAIAESLGVAPSTVTRWLKREDVRALRAAALEEVIAGMVPKAYAILQAQLDSTNPWVAQGAAREIIRLYQMQTGQSDQQVVVSFGQMPTPGTPSSAGHIEGRLVETEDEDQDEEQD